MKNAHLMKRRSFLLMTSAAGASVAFPAYADYVNSVRDQLRQQGYRQISVSSTMLGRTRIVAKSKTGTREIIMNPRTGEILRDLWSSAQGSSGPSIVGSDADDPDDGQDDNGRTLLVHFVCSSLWVVRRRAGCGGRRWPRGTIPA